MQNRGNCGCQNGFVPVNGNWDFNMDRACPRQNRSHACEAETTCKRERNTNRGCQAECASAARPQNTCTGRADCTCDACARRREACNPCEKTKHKADNRGVGIVWAKKQELDAMYDCGRALKAGTLYPELHKPLNGYCPCDEAAGDECQQKAFTLWELRLYLNTHPHDQEAQALFRKLCDESCCPNYAATFLTEDCARWAWTDDPWPWEYDFNAKHPCCE